MARVIPGRPRRRPRAGVRRALLAVVIVVLAVAGLALWSTRRQAGDRASPPDSGPAPASTAVGGAAGAARADLAALPVKGWDRAQDFARSRFGKAWSDDVDVEFGHNGCNTRDDILRRDLADLVVRAGTCYAQTGTLHDPYTGATIAFVRGPDTSDGVQIDHVVSLADAWYKGARTWDGQRRLNFANDPRNLLAVSSKANSDKAFHDAAGWLPPSVAFRCAFVVRQVEVKKAYGLWVSLIEKRAIEKVLASC